MDTAHSESLKALARRYVWWKTPDDAIAMPDRLIAQVMDIGDYADVQHLVERLGEDRLRNVLTHAEAGQFDARSWAYWHYPSKHDTSGSVTAAHGGTTTRITRPPATSTFRPRLECCPRRKGAVARIAPVRRTQTTRTTGASSMQSGKNERTRLDRRH